MVDFPHTTPSVYRFAITLKFTDYSVYGYLIQAVSEDQSRLSRKGSESKQVAASLRDAKFPILVSPRCEILYFGETRLPVLVRKFIHTFSIPIEGSLTVFRVKICGIKLKSDVDCVRAAGGDAVGLNFFSKSVRYVDPESVSTMELSIHAQNSGLKRVGVFANASAEAIEKAIRPTSGHPNLIDIIQLHGDETLAEARQVESIGLPILRAIKLPTSPMDIGKIERSVRPWIDAGYAVLLDADGGAMHGGSGKTLDWASIRTWAESDQQRSTWILAGGLHPENVSEAIRLSGAARVDVASGVEEIRGQKSYAKIQAFCQAALK
ncbi:N-(5'-phosphoribosyl)anthranilate isomerase [Novipirellula aureliae]|uniref:N-(5'-phosphoribosyl)anthranilate isomerase n=1 Tax=Novipirellula aureliae TaxID=2527966 RepID=A0A5C6E944_9BACT|nr:phosphoribosylanthranilate isomerase [Novipirellula aureliae]TWU44006.1 N-(5'-phosphoribosyl)anthranilate isomerase [Novipirellula aureliae]